MSISNRHTVVKFVSGETKAMTGQRLAKVGYKSTKKNPAKFNSIAVSVPHINPAEIEKNYIKLLPHIGALIENAQDGIIRSLYESSDGKLTEVGDNDISVEACIAYMNSDSDGGRLTKAYLESWFDSNCADMLFVAIAEKCGYGGNGIDPTPEQTVQLNNSVKIYRDLISSLSGGATMFTPGQINGVKKMFDTLMIGDDTEKKLIARIKKMEEKKEEVNLEDLL